MISILWAEAVHCARQLARTRGFTLPAVAGLALGIGATTAIFSVYHTLLLSSMGFADIGRLVSLCPTDVQRGQKHVEVSYGELQDWRQRASLLEDAALASSVNLDFALTGDGPPQQVESTIVTGNFFRLLGATPAAGRLLIDEDDTASSPKRVVISHRLWQTRFGGQHSVVGSQLRSGSESFTIVGVAASEFDFPRDVDVWLPLRVGWPTVEQNPRLKVFRSIGRLKSGVGVGQLQAQMSRRFAAHGIGHSPWRGRGVDREPPLYQPAISSEPARPSHLCRRRRGNSSCRGTGLRGASDAGCAGRSAADFAEQLTLVLQIEDGPRLASRAGNPARGPAFSGSSRLKAGCGHDRPPHKAAAAGFACTAKRSPRARPAAV